MTTEADRWAAMQVTLAARIRALRAAAGLSVSEAARRLGQSRPTYYATEAGLREVTAREAVLLTEIYRVDIRWLLDIPIPALHAFGSAKAKPRGFRPRCPLRFISARRVLVLADVHERGLHAGDQLLLDIPVPAAECVGKEVVAVVQRRPVLGVVTLDEAGVPKIVGHSSLGLAWRVSGTQRAARRGAHDPDAEPVVPNVPAFRVEAPASDEGRPSPRNASAPKPRVGSARRRLALTSLRRPSNSSASPPPDRQASPSAPPVPGENHSGEGLVVQPSVATQVEDKPATKGPN